MNKVRSYDLETGKRRLGSAGHDDERRFRRRSSATGMVFLMSGFRGNNLKAIRLADAKGDITRHRRHRVEARSRHAVRAVAAALRRHPLLPEDEQRPAVGVRRRSGQAALPGAAARQGAERVRVAGRRRRPRLHRRAATARRSCSSTGRPSRCSPRTRSTTGSMRRRRWSTASSSCAATRFLYCIAAAN